MLRPWVAIASVFCFRKGHKWCDVLSGVCQRVSWIQLPLVSAEAVSPRGAQLFLENSSLFKAVDTILDYWLLTQQPFRLSWVLAWFSKSRLVYLSDTKSKFLSHLSFAQEYIQFGIVWTLMMPFPKSSTDPLYLLHVVFKRNEVPQNVAHFPSLMFSHILVSDPAIPQIFLLFTQKWAEPCKNYLIPNSHRQTRKVPWLIVLKVTKRTSRDVLSQSKSYY